MSLYTESRRYYTEAPKIIQSRGSSSDSRSSYDSRRSTEERHYPSSKSSTGYYGGSQSKVMEVPKERTYRAPDAGTYISITRTRRIITNKGGFAEEKRISSTTRGKVEVIQQRQRIYEPEAPHSSDATSSHYKDAQRHGSNRHSSSHKHSSHRR
jgi:hypothetical protein